MHTPVRLYTGLLIAAVLLGGCTEQAHEFRLLVPAQLVDREVATELAEVFERNSRHRITLVPAPADSETALESLENGNADIAFATNAQAYRQGITAVMPMYPTVLHIICRRDRDASDPRTLLRGARVYAGPAGSASRVMTEDLLDNLELEPEDVDFIEVTDELPDVVVLFAPISPDRFDALKADLDIEVEYRLLSIGSPGDIGTGSVIDRATLLNPRLSAFVIPVGTYGDLTAEPVVTLAVDKLLVARPGLGESEVYDLINEILRLRPALAARHPMLFQHLDGDFDQADPVFVLHPGAQAFARRDAPDIYERYSGVAEVLVTLVIGTVSGVFAIMQIYNRRRKNRIDEFYKAVMTIRNSLGGDSSSAERAAAVEQLRKLQDSAFELLVDEKLAADDSFRIFVTLSNDIIAECKV